MLLRAETLNEKLKQDAKTKDADGMQVMSVLRRVGGSSPGPKRLG